MPKFNASNLVCPQCSARLSVVSPSSIGGSRARQAVNWSAAGRKAWQTRRINILLGSYNACGQSPGRKAALRKQINAILAEKV